MLCKNVEGSLPEMKTKKRELTCKDRFELQSTVTQLDTTLTRNSQGKDNLVPQDWNSKTVHSSDVAGQRCCQQLTRDDDQQVTVREVSLQESKVSPHFYQKSTGEFMVKEQIDSGRGQIAIEESEQRKKQPGLVAVSTLVTGAHSSQMDLQNQQAQSLMSPGRHRFNHPPEAPIASGVASVESITDSLTPSNDNSPSAITAPMPSLVAKADQPVIGLRQNKQVETISKLVSLFQHSMELDNDQQPEQPNQQQMPSPHFSLQHVGKPSFQWHSVGQLGQKGKKRDELFPKTKLVQSTRDFQKPEDRGPLQSTLLSKSGKLSQPITYTAVPTSIGASFNSMTVPVVVGQQREKPLGLETVSTATGVNSSQLDSQNEKVQPSMSSGRYRSNSLPEIPMSSRVASAGSTTDSMTSSNINSPTGSEPMPSLAAKVDQPVAVLSQNNNVETVSKLVSMFQNSIELDNDQQAEQPDPQQMPSWCFSQQQDGKLSFQLGQKNEKRDGSLQKTKFEQISRQLQKLEVGGASQSSPLSESGELSQPLTSEAVLTGCFGASYDKMAAHVALRQPREEPLATVSTKIAGVNSCQLDSQNRQVQPSMSFGRCRPNSPPEMLIASGSASPESVTDSMTPLNVPSPSTGTASMCSFVGKSRKTDRPVAALGQNKQLETISKLVSVLQRHGLHTRKRKVDELPEVRKQPHDWPLHLNAVSSDANNEDQQDAKGRSVMDSMTPSNTNSSSTGTAPMQSLVAKTDQLALGLCEDLHLETISKLVTMFQRHSLHTKKRKIEEFPEVKKQQLYQPLQLIALPSDVNNEDQQDVKGHRSMASSLVLGGVKVCKSRIINFERREFLPQGTPVMLCINRVRLVMRERAKDGMVEAVVQYLSSSTPHDDLVSLPNTHYADTLAMQFCSLMIKDGYKLTEDQVQPIQSQPKFPPIPASAV